MGYEFDIIEISRRRFSNEPRIYAVLTNCERTLHSSNRYIRENRYSRFLQLEHTEGGHTDERERRRRRLFAVRMVRGVSGSGDVLLWICRIRRRGYYRWKRVVYIINPFCLATRRIRRRANNIIYRPRYLLLFRVRPRVCDNIGEEAKKPTRDIPLAIVISLFIITSSYCSVAVVLTLMWPYYKQVTRERVFICYGRDYVCKKKKRNRSRRILVYSVKLLAACRLTNVGTT